jgi:hypothetical protein
MDKQSSGIRPSSSVFTMRRIFRDAVSRGTNSADVTADHELGGDIPCGRHSGWRRLDQSAGILGSVFRALSE